MCELRGKSRFVVAATTKPGVQLGHLIPSIEPRHQLFQPAQIQRLHQVEQMPAIYRLHLQLGKIGNSSITVPLSVTMKLIKLSPCYSLKLKFANVFLCLSLNLNICACPGANITSWSNITSTFSPSLHRIFSISSSHSTPGIFARRMFRTWRRMAIWGICSGARRCNSACEVRDDLHARFQIRRAEYVGYKVWWEFRGIDWSVDFLSDFGCMLGRSNQRIRYESFCEGLLVATYLAICSPSRGMLRSICVLSVWVKVFR